VSESVVSEKNIMIRKCGVNHILQESVVFEKHYDNHGNGYHVIWIPLKIISCQAVNDFQQSEVTNFAPDHYCAEHYLEFVPREPELHMILGIFLSISYHSPIFVTIIRTNEL
jgi:hypothetical protein